MPAREVSFLPKSRLNRPSPSPAPTPAANFCRAWTAWAWLGRARPVAGKGHLTEARRRIKAVKEFIHGNRRCSGGELFDLYQGGPFCWSRVPRKDTGKGPLPFRARDRT